MDERNCISDYFLRNDSRKRIGYHSVSGDFLVGFFIHPLGVVAINRRNGGKLVADCLTRGDGYRFVSLRIVKINGRFESDYDLLSVLALARLRRLGSLTALGCWLLFLFFNVAYAGKHEWRKIARGESKSGSFSFSNFLEPIRTIVIGHELIALEVEAGNGDGNRCAKVNLRAVFLN